MEKHLIDVLIEDEDGEKDYQLARIVSKVDNGFIVQFLSETSRLYEDRMTIFRFDKETAEIDEKSVNGYYDTDDIEKAGYIKINGVGYVDKDEYDDDYSPTESDEEHYSESDSESISLVDEDEEEEDEEEE
jgi:hypothetical protein